MYDDNENFRLDDDFESPSQKIIDMYESGEDEEEVTEDISNTIDVTTELDINRKNREGYEQLMKESSTKLDGYWDSNDPFIKAILIGLLAIIGIGVIIVFSAYFAS